MTDDELNELFHDIYNAGVDDAVAESARNGKDGGIKNENN